MPDSLLPHIPENCTLRHEFRLLAASSWIAPPEFENLQAEKIASLCSDTTDWRLFLSLARRHEVQALVYETLRRHAADKVPTSILAELREWKFRISAQSLFQADEMFNLSAKFAGPGIDLMPLKGGILSLQLYGDPGMRNSCDLDILVRQEQVDAACRLLETEGYTCGLLGNQMTVKQRAYLRTNFHHLEYSHPEKGLFLELHWRFGALWLPGQMAAIWDGAAEMEWMGRRIRCLDDDSQLLYLSDHGARHGFYSLKWVSDIARILVSGRSHGWDSLLGLAERLDLKRTLAHSALLAHWLYGIPLAEELQGLIRGERYAVEISTTVYGMLSYNGNDGASRGKPKGSLKLAWQKLRLRPSVPFRMTLKPKLIALFDFLDFPLPDRFFWLYYLLRPVTMLWRHFFRK